MVSANPVKLEASSLEKALILFLGPLPTAELDEHVQVYCLRRARPIIPRDDHLYQQQRPSWSERVDDGVAEPASLFSTNGWLSSITQVSQEAIQSRVCAILITLFSAHRDSRLALNRERKLRNPRSCAERIFAHR
jgi:hypothetical protein